MDSENRDGLSYLAAAERDTAGSQPGQASPVSAPVADQPSSFAAGRVSGYLQRSGHEAVDGEGFVAAGDT